MQCRNESCNNEAKGKGRYCSATCKTVFNRNKTTVTSAAVTPSRNTVEIGSLEHYRANPTMYIERREPDRLNWGKRLNMNELNIAGKKANRVPIPGDCDYTAPQEAAQGTNAC